MSIGIWEVYSRFCAKQAAVYHKKYVSTINSTEKLDSKKEEEFLKAIE